MQDAWQLLLRRLELEPPIFHADEFQGELVNWRERMKGAGVLQRIAASASACCPYCRMDSMRTVTFLDDQRTDGQRGYIMCRECGLVEVPSERLQRWTVDVPGFLASVFTDGGATVRPRELVEGCLWQVGKATWAGRSREVWFARAFRTERTANMTKPLEGRPKAIVFTPTEVAADRWRGVTNNLVIALESTLSAVDGSLLFDTDYVEGRIADAGLRADVAPKRPPMKRGPRPAKIEALRVELIKHLQSARDYAFFTKEESGTPELLPRPMQKDLGARVGLSQSDVSRCLSDDKAGELRLYWEMADDLNQIMRWSGNGKRRGSDRRRPPCESRRASTTTT